MASQTDYKATYLKGMGYDEFDFIPCEMCGKRMTDTHHIDARGMGGSKHKYTVEELMGLCRNCHVKYGDKKHYMQLLKHVHLDLLKSRKMRRG